MAEDEGDPCDIVGTRDAHFFQFRVRYSAIKDLAADHYERASTDFAGYTCTVGCSGAGGQHGLIKMMLLVHSTPDRTLRGSKLVVDMVLLDKAGSPVCRGSHLHARREVVEARCVAAGHFAVLCSVAVIRDWPPPPPAAAGELPDLGPRLAGMLDATHDVSFVVAGETFAAHRLVLAARSPVFRAELYGPMAESRMSSIAIEDMGASTFGAMLHYMYHGWLPTGTAAVGAEDLLAAADRYGLETLKQLCEEKLSGGIAVDTVVSIMELAERHTCRGLKARCVEFLKDGEVFKMVATTDEYLQLMQSFPSLMVEVRSLFKRKRTADNTVLLAANGKKPKCMHGIGGGSDPSYSCVQLD